MQSSPNSGHVVSEKLIGCRDDRGVAPEPPSSNPKLSSRDASARLIETQEAFILSLQLSLWPPFTPLFYLSILPFLLSPLRPPHPLYLISIHSSCWFSLHLILCLNVTAAIFLAFRPFHSPPSQELNLVYSRGMINCDTERRKKKPSYE